MQAKRNPLDLKFSYFKTKSLILEKIKNQKSNTSKKLKLKEIKNNQKGYFGSTFQKKKIIYKAYQ